MRWTELAGRRVAVLGCGRDAAAVLRHWPQATDMPMPPVLSEHPPAAELAAEWATVAGTALSIGPFDGRQLAGYEILIKSPGISRHHPALAKARAAGVRLVTPAALALAARGATQVVAITGTKGKSTAASLLVAMLQAAGIDAALGGNIGIPALDLLAGRHALWVLELSSYQLADLDEQVECGAILNLFPEHLDWHGSFAAYARDKLRLAGLAARVWADAGVIAEYGSIERLNEATPLGSADGLHGTTAGIADGERLLLAADRLPLKGAHNRSNIAAMWQIARHLGAGDAAVLAALERFTPLPHRMQVLGVHGGLTWIDDSISTTPRATLAAIEAFSGPPLTVLIGGYDRGVDWSAALHELAGAGLHAVIGVGEQGTRLVAAFDRAGGSLPGGIHTAAELPAAVDLAAVLTPPGGIVLLSPGAPSFDRYSDYQARGAHFAALAARLDNGGVR